MQLFKTSLVATFLFFSTTLFAQFDLNNVSVEVGYGYNGAMALPVQNGAINTLLSLGKRL